jgi:hypothetical protein
MSRGVDAALIVLAIASRVAAVLVLQSHVVPRSTYEHGEIAANLVAGRGFSMRFLGADGPTSQQAPVYPFLVAVAYAWFGADTPQALLALELGQAVLGGVLVLGVLRLARGISPDPPWLAWIAALVAALHPTLVYAATHVQVAMLGSTLLVWTLAFAHQAGTTRRLRDAGCTGALLAASALTDPILALASVGIAVAIRGSAAIVPLSLWGSARLLAVVGIVALAGTAPWLVRNALTHGEFVPIKSTFGYAFWQGNCALSAGTDKVVRQSVDRILHKRAGALDWNALNRMLWVARHEAGYIDDIVLTKDDYRRLGAMSEPERSRTLYRRVIAELSAEPSRYWRLCLKRLQYFVLFDETNPKSRVLAFRVPHLGLTIFGGIGLILAGARLRRRLMPTIITAAAIVVFHSLTIVSTRFHIPLEPLLAVWGAAGLAGFAGRSAERNLRVPHSGAARHDVERVGVEDRLAVVREMSRFCCL